MTVPERSNGAGGLIRGMADLLRGPLVSRSVGPFAERSRGFYVSARLWFNASGFVALTAISVLQGWRPGFVLASLAGALAVHTTKHAPATTAVTMVRIFSPSSLAGVG